VLEALALPPTELPLAVDDSDVDDDAPPVTAELPKLVGGVGVGALLLLKPP
jgi:hypothetical protein